MTRNQGRRVASVGTGDAGLIGRRTFRFPFKPQAVCIMEEGERIETAAIKSSTEETHISE